jgi:hypothetical protein
MLAAPRRSPLQEDFVDASIRQFWAPAKAPLQACTEFDANRQSKLDYVERVIFDHYKGHGDRRRAVADCFGDQQACFFGSRARST